MLKPFRTAAVLGAGVMGAQIAAHLANAGLTVHLLDLPAATGDRNSLVEGAFKKAAKLSPAIFVTEQAKQRVILGNYEDHFDRLATVDWVIEAVVENLLIKQQLMARIEQTVGRETVISTNTSGLGIAAIAHGRTLDFRQRFLGTHFFNPPRYLKLLELIPTADTRPEVLAQMQAFGRMRLGKGIVVAKDTPNFIANRIGIFVSLLGLHAFTDQGYTIEEVDTLTGTLVGRPKSGTFRTADLVGLDTLMYVAENLYPVIPQDERRDQFRVPDLLRRLVETGTLGSKSGQGFYKKVAGEIRSLNAQTLAYESPQPLKLGHLDKLQSQSDLRKRLQGLYCDRTRAGQLFRQMTLETLAYSANRIPEVADSPAEVDRAMRWGFGWELGPFELWDVLGFETVRVDMAQVGLTLPDWVTAMAQQGMTGFYRTPVADPSLTPRPQGMTPRQVYGPGQVWVTLPQAADEIHLGDGAYPVLWQNSESALLDLGDGVTLFEFRSKANTLSTKVISGLEEALTWLENHDYRGMVIGNEGTNFCVGINLAEVGKIAQWESLNPFNHSHSGIANLLVRFQQLMQRIHYFHKPIVAAIHGRVLGGGSELVMACPQVVADVETYMGLVELAVGLIPAGGGLMRMARWASRHALTEELGDGLPYLKRVFETIGMAKVATSAYEAMELGFLPTTTQVVMNGDRRLYVAKQVVIGLDAIGYAPPPHETIRVWGQPARAVLDHMAYVMEQAHYISEYDRRLANRLAYVLTGGELTVAAQVDEAYLLQLERENFLPLVDAPQTKERILHMLKTKKPLRN